MKILRDINDVCHMSEDEKLLKRRSFCRLLNNTWTPESLQELWARCMFARLCHPLKVYVKRGFSEMYHLQFLYQLSRCHPFLCLSLSQCTYEATWLSRGRTRGRTFTCNNKHTLCWRCRRLNTHHSSSILLRKGNQVAREHWICFFSFTVSCISAYCWECCPSALLITRCSVCRNDLLGSFHAAFQ